MACWCCVLAGGSAPAAKAQVPAPSPLRPVACNGQEITAIGVRTQPPSYGGVIARTGWMIRLATSLHRTTHARVIENLVLLRPGEPCSFLLLRETERLLRAQPFLADATVSALADGIGGVRIEVVTVDEPALLGALGVSGIAPHLRALRAGTSNVQGRGVSTLAGWRDGGFYRDTWQFRYSNFQLFAAPVQMHVAGIRRDHGYEATALVAYPFFTDLQRRAWRVGGGATEILAPFRTPGRAGVALGVRREFFDAGAVARIGEPGRLAMVGGAVSMERSVPAAEAVVVTDTGLVADTGSVLRDRYERRRSGRVNLLFGYRQVNFLRVSGFDALAGTQDMRRGVQAALAVGSGLSIGGAAGKELFISGSVYGGVGSAVSFAGLEVLAEGRRMRAGVWEALLMSGRLGTYFRPHPRHTIAGSVEFSAGRRQWLPFQLALGDPRGGVRGYQHAELGGAARLVTRVEERWRVGNIRGTGDLGVAVFGETGKLWAGDAPYGVTTPFKPSVGVALLAAVPARSRRIWRLDIAFPLDREAGARWGMRLTNEDRTRVFWNEPNDVRRNRERSGLLTTYVP